MKRSLVVEASSLPRAVEEAWEAAGRPEEFTIKVFESEKSGFFGFRKQIIVVSIVFDAKQTGKDEDKKTSRRDAGSSRERQQDDSRRNTQYTQNRRRSSSRRSDGGKSRYKQRGSADSVDRRERDREGSDRFERESWESDFINDVNHWVAELNDAMNIKVHYAVRVEKNLLKIEYDEPIFESPSEERMLFASMTYVLMQFLKRKHKKKFRTSKIVITSKR